MDRQDFNILFYSNNADNHNYYLNIKCLYSHSCLYIYVCVHKSAQVPEKCSHVSGPLELK